MTTEQILSAFPLLDDEGLDEEKHHCEWTLQQDRKRLHAMLASAPQRNPLTDEEKLALLKKHFNAVCVPDWFDALLIDIEAKLKEKNT